MCHPHTAPNPDPTMPLLGDDLQKPWKLNLSATLAGKVEYLLTDPLLRKPIYGARTKLVENLLEYWIAQNEGRDPPSLLTLDQLRNPQ